MYNKGKTMHNYFDLLKISEDESSLGMKRMFADEILVNIENPAGTERIGMDKGKKEWRIKMKYDYGFIHCVKGADGEGLDVYLGPNQEAKKVFVIHQNDPSTKEYDEDKVMLGFENGKEAKKAYLDHYNSLDFFGSMTVMDFDEFLNIVKNGKKERVSWNIKDKRKKNK
jgi:hypothetical protein